MLSRPRNPAIAYNKSFMEITVARTNSSRFNERVFGFSNDFLAAKTEFTKPGFKVQRDQNSVNDRLSVNPLIPKRHFM